MSDTTIRAACPNCGEVPLRAEAVILRVQGARSTYTFTCPSCHDGITKRADARIVRLLLSGGVRPTPPDVPAEALEVHEGPPLTVDDLLDFHQALERDDAFLERNE